MQRSREERDDAEVPYGRLRFDEGQIWLNWGTFAIRLCWRAHDGHEWLEYRREIEL
jgi:hypothetical protein